MEDEDDIESPSWPSRALVRWITYTVLWTAAVTLAALSELHYTIRIAGLLAGGLLAASLPLQCATLFEAANARRSARDLPVVVCPWLGGLVVLGGILSLVQASSAVVRSLTSESAASAEDLCARFATLPRQHLPQSVCVRSAFVKTDWEAGKLECKDVDGHVTCNKAFVAAPVFNSKAAADQGLPDEIFAWAVTGGRHVDAKYREDGSLCGFLSMHYALDFFLGDFRLAVQRAIVKYELSLSQSSTPTAQDAVQVPLEARPLLMTVDPNDDIANKRVWLVIGVIFLCLCPCAGPVPLGVVLVYCSWLRGDRYRGRRVVPSDDQDLQSVFY